jgi:hypothetical protein
LILFSGQVIQRLSELKGSGGHAAHLYKVFAMYVANCIDQHQAEKKYMPEIRETT